MQVFAIDEPQFPMPPESITGMDRYRIFRPFLDNGDALEWASSTALGWLIRKFTKKDVNHTGSVLRMRQFEEDAGDRIFTPEATSKGVALTYLSCELEKFKGAVYWLPLKPKFDDRRNAIARHELGVVGRPYDFDGLFTNAIRRVSEDTNAFFCSEFKGWSLAKAGVIKPQGKALRPGEFERLGVFLPRVRVF